MLLAPATAASATAGRADSRNPARASSLRPVASPSNSTTGVLPIQGPPGTGKTYAGARMILDLVRGPETRGDHGPVAQDDQQPPRGRDGAPRREERTSPSGPSRRPTRTAITSVISTGVTRVGEQRRTSRTRSTAGTVDVVAGTAWLLARPEFDGAFDVLFVDEASQMSLANAVAIGTCAGSIVLIGDPNQLPMVSQGVHPDGAGGDLAGAPRR